jgi:hypothetical protein
MKVFSIMTGTQIAVGFLFLASLPRPVLLLFMGGDALATVLLALGLVSGLLLLVAGMAGRVWLCVGMVVPQLYVMSFMRDIVRNGYLLPHFSPASLHVIPQYSPMFMFVVSLAAGLATVVWMVRKAGSALRTTRR